MSLSNEPVIKRNDKVSLFIDKGLENIASSIDHVRNNLLTQNNSATKPLPFANNIADQLAVATDKLRNTRGEEMVKFAKVQVEKHPALLTITVAAIGAAVAQIAVATVRKERARSEVPEDFEQTTQ